MKLMKTDNRYKLYKKEGFACYVIPSGGHEPQKLRAWCIEIWGPETTWHNRRQDNFYWRHVYAKYVNSIIKTPSKFYFKSEQEATLFMLRWN